MSNVVDPEFDRDLPGDTPPAVSDLDLEKASPELRALIGQAERDTIPWISSDRPPKVGSNVYGKVVDISDVPSTFRDGKLYPLLTIETPTGRLVTVHCFHTVLWNEVERKIKRGTIAIGSNIAITYKGLGPKVGDKAPAELYRVVANPPQK